MTKLKFKKLPIVVGKDDNEMDIIEDSTALLPVRAHDSDAGYDLVATRITQELDEAGKVILVYHTDLAVEIPEGYVGLLFMRSSVAHYSIMLCNAVGVIDSGYRGELMMKYKVTTDSLPRVYTPGEKIGQLVLVQYAGFDTEMVDELSSTDRGEGGFGSTDNKQDEHNIGELATGDSTLSESTI